MLGETGVSQVAARAVKSTLAVAAASPSSAAVSALLIYLAVRVRRQVRD